MYANALPPLDFVTAVKNCLSNYVTLEGRARRSEYWWFVLPVYIMDFLFFLLEILYASGAIKIYDYSSSSSSSSYNPYYPYDPYPSSSTYYKSHKNTGAIVTLAIFIVLFSCGLMLPLLCATVRRLHDIGKRGEYIFILLVPLYGPITLLVLLCRDSQPETNKFGPSPKYNQAQLQTQPQGLGAPLLQSNIVYQPNNNIIAPNNNIIVPINNVMAPTNNIITQNNNINDISKPVPMNQVTNSNEYNNV